MCCLAAASKLAGWLLRTSVPALHHFCVHLHAVDNGRASIYEDLAFQAKLIHLAVFSVELGRCLQGQVLGCGAHLTALRRESIGEHSVANAWVLSDLADAAREARETQT